MTAVEIVGNLYIRNQIIEEQLQVISTEKAQLEQIVTAFKSKEYAQRLATALGDGAATVEYIDRVEKALADPKLLIPDVPEVTEAAVIAARESAANEASTAEQPAVTDPEVIEQQHKVAADIGA